MKLLLLPLCLVLVFAPSAFAAPVFGYNILVTTGYGFGNPFGGSTFLGGGSPSPDTGFVQILNQGTTTFSGSLGTVAVSNFGGDVSFSTPWTLGPGQAVSIAIGFESSNIGGFNGPFGSPQPGVQVFLNGAINGSEAVNLSVVDSNIHSGSARVSPCDGITTDAYVLQGGSPIGCDNGDGFETSQAQGNFQFFEAAPTAPEPGSLMLLGTGVIGAIGVIRRKLS
jgi:hypothetical protein